MSQIAGERDDLAAATRHLLHAEALGEHTWLPQNPYRWRVAMARVREAEGDLDGALDLLDEAQRVYMGDFSPNVRPIPALRARVLAVQGHVGEALAWAREQGLSAEDDLSYLREFEHITLARALLAQYRAQGAVPPLHDAARLLQRLLLHAWSHRGGSTRGEQTAAGQGLVEPLSERELEVLRLLGSDLDGPDIARELTVSLNTLRTHTKNIYAKLGVISRRAAVRQAAELNLLSRTRDR